LLPVVANDAKTLSQAVPRCHIWAVRDSLKKPRKSQNSLILAGTALLEN
jgi:hypothetical protein